MAEPIGRAANRLPIDESREHLMAQIARMTYQQDKTLTEIATAIFALEHADDR